MKRLLIIILMIVRIGSGQTAQDPCCKCDTRVNSERPRDVVCLSAKEMRAHVARIEPLRPSGLGTGLHVAGTLAVEVRFAPDGKVACARAASGHPIAISAAMEALP